MVAHSDGIYEDAIVSQVEIRAICASGKSVDSNRAVRMSKHKFTLKQSARADDFDKKTPALRGMWKVIEDTINEGDRGAVLILTSFLEELTKRILLAFMIEGTKEKDFTDGWERSTRNV